LSNQQYIQGFLDDLSFSKRYSQHTITSYKNDLNKFNQYLCSVYDYLLFEKVELFHVRSYLVYLLNLNLEKTTVARNISSVKSFYKYLIKEEVVNSSPLNLLESPKINKRLPSFIKEDELVFLFDKIEFEQSFLGLRDKLLIMLFYQTGVRLSEIIHLKNDSVSSKYIKVLGKRNKERIIPISSNTFNFIEIYFEQKNNKFPNTEFFFITDNGKKMYEKFVYRKVNYYLSLVSSKQKKSPHILRHTFATHMLNNGADLNAIKEILGHENLSATQVYTHNTFQKLKSIHQQSHPRG